MITRRRLLIALGLNSLVINTNARLANAAPPPGKILRLGLLYGIREKFDPESNSFDSALAESLRAHGFEIGRNVNLEFRSAMGNFERLPALAADLVRVKVDILITLGSSPALAAHETTKTIPIVAIAVDDPVDIGMAASFARPGGNVTGPSINSAEISAKRVELLKEAVPKLSRVAVLWNSTLKSMMLQFQRVETAAPALGVTVQSIRVSSSDNFGQAFEAITKGRAQGLIVLFGPMRGNDLPRIVEFVTRNRLPAVFELGRGVSGGGLMEFGPDTAELARHVGAYVDKIANGAKPADLPIEEPTKFQLIINLKAARTMGLTMPPSLLLRADRMIE
jgi:putative ABC transport system substrate-binding protein